MAVASERPDLGVDVERIAPRSPSFVELSFHPDEVRMGGPESPELWLTRAWVAKECVAKAQGTGLEGKPLGFRIIHRSGDALLVEGAERSKTWVGTVRRGDFVIGWTVAEPSPARPEETQPVSR